MKHGKLKPQALGLTRIGNGYRPVATDGLEVEDQQEVDGGHSDRKSGIGFQRLASASDIAFNHRLLIRSELGFFSGDVVVLLFLSQLFRSLHLGAVQSRNLLEQPEQALRFFSFVCSENHLLAIGFQMFSSEAILGIAEAGSTNLSYGEHANAAHDGHRHRT